MVRFTLFTRAILIPACILLGLITYFSFTAPAIEAAQMKTYPVNVYFSRHPQSDTNLKQVFAVQRISPTLGVAAFSIAQLLKGPTMAEKQAGYYTPLTRMLAGPSHCASNGDFTLRLDSKKATYQSGTVTLQFCRASSSNGIGDDAHASSEIQATLKQFPKIKKVIILDYQGNCFGDGSGMNICLRN